MLKVRVIPCLLLRGSGLVKTVKFNNANYIGDPINAVKIFDTKEVPELIFLDINASRDNKEISFDLIENIAEECYMPFAVGGGIRTLEDVKALLHNGAEKVVINSAAVENPGLVSQVSEVFGSQSVVVSIDAKKGLFGGYKVYTHGGTKSTKLDPVAHAVDMERRGAGEIMINSINNDGMMEGYDNNLVQSVSTAVGIPVIACGGAGKLDDFAEAVKKGASAVAAGSLFVYHGPRRAVLINYPDKQELKGLFS